MRREGCKLYHVVMPHGTITFTSYEEALEFLRPVLLRGVEGGGAPLMCESEVTGSDYNRVCRWRER